MYFIPSFISGAYYGAWSIRNVQDLFIIKKYRVLNVIPITEAVIINDYNIE